ncbi:MAG: sugar phosphate isomerase/epimerase, partial [Treponema sp.]|nr:sugar phosphate isomerase/epimerase [Treponema sp.]
PYVQGLWDPGNDIWDPDNEIPYPDGYNFIKKYISHVHLKDGRRINGKAEGAPIGRGEVDWKGQFRALIDDGYSGFVTLETHYRPAKKFSAQELAMPKGAAFSLGGYGATKESLGLWKKLLSSI